MKKILCVGGCVIDILVISENIPIINHNNKKFLGIEYGSKTPGLKFIINEGGSATNLALNLKCLGLNSALLATIGDDFMGNFIYNSIQASGLDYRGLIQLPNTNTGIAFIVKSSNHNDRGMITIKGASDLLSKSLINKEFINDYDWLAWCSLTSESALNTINELIKIFKTRKNGLIIAAPSSSMIKKYPRKTFEMVMNSNILASNLEEAKILLDIDDLSWVETAKSFLNLGLSFISITNGENGAIIGNKNELIKIIPPSVNVVDTTGVGDAFLSGLIYGLINKKNLELSGKIGTIMAWSALQDFGTRRGIPTINKVYELMDKIAPKIKIVKLK